MAELNSSIRTPGARSKGYHKIAISANEVMNTNVSLKTGNAKLYTMLLGGMNISSHAKVYSAGYGLGHDFIFSQRIAVSAELSSRYIYLGRITDANFLNRFESALQVRVFKPIALFVAPSYNVFRSTVAHAAMPGFKPTIVPARHKNFSNATKGWVGWSFGFIAF